jgi:hypothetical protein
VRRTAVVLSLLLALPAHAAAPDWPTIGGELAGGLLAGATLCGVVLGGEGGARLGLGWPMAVSAGLSWSLGVGLGSGYNAKDRTAPWPALLGSAIGLTFAVGATLLASNDTQRLIVGIPLTVVLPLVMSVIANEHARSVDDS